MKKQTQIILDVDTGVDDAIAIAFACYLKNIDVTLIATGGGNTGVDNVTKNTLDILQFIQKGMVKVAKGVDGILSKKPFVLQVHGKTGMGEYDFEPLKIKPVEKDVVQAMHDTIQENEGLTTLIALGPSTNIAKLMLAHPEDKAKIEKIVISGGLLEEIGRHAKPYSSFNIAFDEQATKVVLDSGEDVLIVPSNHGHTAYLDYQDVYKTKNKNATGAMFEQIFRTYKDRHVKNGVATHDLCAVFSVSNPEMFKMRKAKVWVEYSELAGAGILKFDFDSSTPNVTVAEEVDIKLFKKIYFRTLKKMP
ncbi:MAG: nucleoside hydrolase [Clostridia bacterium]|nr:nucleoside hydrolase [Clostridia bacterium]